MKTICEIVICAMSTAGISVVLLLVYFFLCRKRTCRKQVVQAVHQGGGRRMIIDGDILDQNVLLGINEEG